MLRAALTLPCLAFLAGADFPAAAKDRGVAATVKVVNAADATEGSGVLVRRSTPHVYVLTAAHVVRKAKAVEVRVAVGGKVRVYKNAEVVAESASADLAVLRIGTRDELPVLPISPAGSKLPAQPVAVGVGWEKGDAPTTITETVLGKVRLRRPGEATATACWEVEKKLIPKRSGGPLVDAAGSVVGVASGHDGTTGYYVHAEEIHEFLRRNGLKWLAEPEEK